MAGPTVLLTGAAGFIGSHLAEALCATGQRVVGIDNFDPFYPRAMKMRNIADLPGDRFELVETDILDSDAIRSLAELIKPDLIVHLAALAGVRPSIASPARYFAVNIDGLVSMLDAARACQCPNFIFASSSSVYGNQPKTPFSEDDPADQPISPYAATKRAGEMICATYAHLFNLRVACLRFFTVFGPRQRPDLAISAFMRLLQERKPIPMFGDGSTSRDYTFIDDIIAGVLASIEHTRSQQPSFCRTFNLGGSHPVSLRELITLVGEVAGVSPVIEQQPRQPGDVERTYADLSRSARELGFSPRTELRTGLEKQWRWFSSLAAFKAPLTLR